MANGQIETAGNGMLVMGKEWVSAAAIIGSVFHFDHTSWIETKHVTIEAKITIIHHALQLIRFQRSNTKYKF